MLAISHGSEDPSPETLALDLYAALLDGTGLPQVLERIAKRLGAASYAALVTEYDGQHVLRGHAVTYANLDPARMVEYGRHWVHQDPWWQAPSQGLLRRLFGLSAAEAALAAAMAEGKSVAAIAQMRGVLPGSLRSQLTAIRRKTGCARQADLAVLLARVGG